MSNSCPICESHHVIPADGNAYRCCDCGVEYETETKRKKLTEAQRKKLAVERFCSGENQ